MSIYLYVAHVRLSQPKLVLVHLLDDIVGEKVLNHRLTSKGLLTSTSSFGAAKLLCTSDDMLLEGSYFELTALQTKTAIQADCPGLP